MPKLAEKDLSICFVIAPIGADGSDVRTRSDQVLRHIIAPAAKECGYDTIRADQISEPGLITSQVIQHIVEDPLVIADLTGHNPNVFYELAVRHALKKPVVQIIDTWESIPFDVAASRMVHVDHHDLDSATRAREEIIKQIRAVERNPGDVDTPISVAIELKSLKQSDNPLEKSNAEIISMLQKLMIAVTDLREDEEGRPPRIPPIMFEEWGMTIDGGRAICDLQEGALPTVEQLEELHRYQYKNERAFDVLCMLAGYAPARFRPRLRCQLPLARKKK